MCLRTIDSGMEMKLAEVSSVLEHGSREQQSSCKFPLSRAPPGENATRVGLDMRGLRMLGAAPDRVQDEGSADNERSRNERKNSGSRKSEA